MATYNTGLSGVDFEVTCTNSITGTYPNVKHIINYKIYLVLGTAYNTTQWNGAILNFGGHSHTVNFNHTGPGKWEMASGRFEYTFNNASRTDSRTLKFSTSFGNTSASGSQTETATIALPSVSEPSVWSNNYQNVSYSASLSSNPNNFYNIRAILGSDARVGGSGSWDGLSPNTGYTVYFYVVYQGAQGTTLTDAISRSVTTKKPNSPNSGNVYASRITYNSAYIYWKNFSIASGASDYHYQTSWNGNDWTDRGKGEGFTLSSLSPNTSYTHYVRIVDNFGQVSSAASVSFTTAKPDKPSKGSVSYSDLNPFGATFSWSGFQIKDGASSYFYQYSFDGNNWSNLGTETSLRLSNLVPETSYTFRIRIVDNYGTVSDFASVSFTTPADQAKIAYNTYTEPYEEPLLVDDDTELRDENDNTIIADLKESVGGVQQTRLWYNDNGVLKKVKKVYFNDNGKIKVHSNFGG